ncbi:unnamed protein product, partial [Heterotrigona itama]
MIGQDLRYKKRFVPPLRPVERRYPFLRVRERTVIIDDGGRRFLQLAPVPNYQRKGFGGPFFWPGRRDCSLEHYRAPTPPVFHCHGKISGKQAASLYHAPLYPPPPCSRFCPLGNDECLTTLSARHREAPAKPGSIR